MNKSISTVLGVPVAYVVWILVFLLAYAILSLWDMSRGLRDDFLQSIFWEWFTPGVGGYAAIHAVHKLFRNASLKWVAIFLCSPLVLFYVVFSIYIILFQSDNYDYVLRDQIIQWGMAIATCIGAVIAIRSLELDS